MSLGAYEPHRADYARMMADPNLSRPIRQAASYMLAVLNAQAVRQRLTDPDLMERNGK